MFILQQRQLAGLANCGAHVVACCFTLWPPAPASCVTLSDRLTGGQLSELGERIRQLHHQHKKLTEEKSGKDITQEFVIRTKRYDLTCALKVIITGVRSVGEG